MTQSTPSPGEARRLLNEAEAGAARGDAIGSRSLIGRTVSIGIAALMGAFLLASVYVFPTATWQLGLALSVGYAVGIVVMVTVYHRMRTVTPIGWLQRYRIGLTISFIVFGCSLALSFIIAERSLLLWGSLAIVTALPLAIAGSLRMSR